VSTERCWYCGNFGTADFPLGWDDDDHQVHKNWPEGPEAEALATRDPAAFDALERPCPPVSVGWKKCLTCHSAKRIGEMVEAELVVPLVDLFPDFGKSETRAPSDSVPPRYVVVDGISWSEKADQPEGTAGLIVTDQLICEKCSSRWPLRPGGPRRLSPTRPGRARPARVDVMTQRAALVPVSGDGLNLAGLGSLWGLTERPTITLVQRLVALGYLRVEERPNPRGGSPFKRYLRVE
jgi:hypothetical protein